MKKYVWFVVSTILGGRSGCKDSFIEAFKLKFTNLVLRVAHEGAFLTGLGDRAVAYLILAAQKRCQKASFAASWRCHWWWCPTTGLCLRRNRRCALLHSLQNEVLKFKFIMDRENLPFSCAAYVWDACGTCRRRRRKRFGRRTRHRLPRDSGNRTRCTLVCYLQVIIISGSILNKWNI